MFAPCFQTLTGSKGEVATDEAQQNGSFQMPVQVRAADVARNRKSQGPVGRNERNSADDPVKLQQKARKLVRIC